MENSLEKFNYPPQVEQFKKLEELGFFDDITPDPDGKRFSADDSEVVFRNKFVELLSTGLLNECIVAAKLLWPLKDPRVTLKPFLPEAFDRAYKNQDYHASMNIISMFGAGEVFVGQYEKTDEQAHKIITNITDTLQSTGF